MKKNAFTLIELLVVIAIIGILSTILFPVFSRARESARRSSCLSNEKQIGLGFMQYTQDFDERYPLYRRATDETPPMLAYKTGYWEWHHMIYSYTKNQQVYRCPNGNRSTNPYTGNYGVNYEVIGAEPPLLLAEVLATAGTYLALDSGTAYMTVADARQPVAGKDRYLPGSKAFSGGTLDVAAQWAQTDYELGRHFDGVNMIFADGHAKWLKSQKVWQEAKNFNATSHPVSAWDPLAKN